MPGTTAAANGGTVPFPVAVPGHLDEPVGEQGHPATGVAPPTPTSPRCSRRRETSNYWSDGEMLVIAHPAWRARLRSITGQTWLRIAKVKQTTTNGIDSTSPRHPVRCSGRLAARREDPRHRGPTSPTGNLLLFVGNRTTSSAVTGPARSTCWPAPTPVPRSSPTRRCFAVRLGAFRRRPGRRLASCSRIGVTQPSPRSGDCPSALGPGPHRTENGMVSKHRQSRRAKTCREFAPRRARRGRCSTARLSFPVRRCKRGLRADW
ncbi:hypothetical protein HBB16_04490 [Pseudonocardia sp. MCCB 268]|nr:hypothetical protein [Pseudonocardia cytotoxica]